jgi:FOG: GAF domain
MNRESQARFVAVLLFLLTVAAVIFAGFNLQKERQFAVPDDGVWWVEHQGQLVADRVDPKGRGAEAGIKAGDQLVAVNGQAVSNTPGLVRQLYRTGVYRSASYSVLRQAVPLDINVLLLPADRSLNIPLRLIALIYLGIGLYVLLRRWTAPGSTHFYIFCLVSFIAYSFKYTGKLNDFDWIIYWSNVVAWVLQPALFLHFVLTFPEKRKSVRERPWLLALAYLPGMALLARHIIALRLAQPSGVLLWDMDRQEIACGAALFIAAAAVLWYSYRRASTTILRQQLKWVTRGTILAIVPYTLVYVIPFLAGALPGTWMKLSVLFLGWLPLTFGYAIFRYRLMDVDLISKRVVVYTVAAAAGVGLYFALVAAVAELVHMQRPSTGPVGLILAVVITALLFDPVRKWIQDRVDHLFYRTVYDYRRTLIEFGRELSSETDLNALLSSVVDRLSRTLAVDRIAMFLRAGEEGEQFAISKSVGMNPVGKLDLTFLSAPRAEPAGHMFFENTHQVPRETAGSQDAIARLDLNYYIPCRAQQRTVAVLGLGKTNTGDYLSSEDIELLETLGGYIGIAIQNGLLYASLQQKCRSTSG